MARVELTAGWEGRVSAAAEEIRDRVLREIADDARRYAPVETGALRNSIEVDGNRVIAGNENVDYAVYQELGTSEMDANPFLRPALFQKRG